ncbi:hypothetical protein ACE1TF_04960 [Geomicrobium sp. JSM 1781026]|uniref:hypothetical protein n=1 Tax=Geomicrobium sp. JSM 1781026 TaxID=3344580 RepID=UPI0035BFDCBA
MNEIEKQVVENFKQDENVMILVFSQWCTNHDLDPQALYKEAYPQQEIHPEHLQTFALAVPKEEAEPIANETVLGVLMMFGNTDLAAVVQQEIDKQK